MQKDVFSEMASRWPSPIVARSEMRRFTGGLYGQQYLANLDSLGQGPPRIIVGRRVAYPVQELAEWLRGRSKIKGAS